ncbi:ester cyclase [Celeribacter arenosi]|uniref:SnoaL-like polyketide cyclase n=1 Tax=Celeribacter arenosi TaxID=792649 RepID=A0ABP7KES8_9RHOB
MTGVELLEKWYQHVWVEGDLEAVQRYFDTEALAGGLLPDLAVQIEDFQAIVPAVLRLVTKVQCEIVDSMEVDDCAWALVRLNALNRENLRPISITGQVMIRHKNGKVVHAQNHFDYVGFFEQLGNLPRDTMALCLAGEVLS